MNPTSAVVKECQVCQGNLKSVLFLGYLPPVNRATKIGERPSEQSAYPVEMLRCMRCHLVQIGCIVDPRVLFPAEYPYTSSTTKILRENFADLYQQVKTDLAPDDLVVDIGSNDGNLLSNFLKHRVLGVTPEDIGKIAIARGIPTILDYFDQRICTQIQHDHGLAKLVTATNVFAHIDFPKVLVNNIKSIMRPDGIFVSESHYLGSLIETCQYDTMYSEHLRYYSLHSLQYLLEDNGIEVFHVQKIPTHGGSIRVFAALKGQRPITATVEDLLQEERVKVLPDGAMEKFKRRVASTKLETYRLLAEIKASGARIFGIGAPSRASTLISYLGLDEQILDVVLETPGSYKIGNYMPGTVIPIESEERLYIDQPEYAFLLSWHIADELMPKLQAKGFRGKFIIPLPAPRIHSSI